MSQYGFFFDQSRCTGCRACAVACKQWHGLPSGALNYLRIYEYETGAFPDVAIHYNWMPCWHCEDPFCVSACPPKAIRKEPKYGAVLVDEEVCDGCRICYDVCPYGSPTFESDGLGVKARKCNMCIDRLEHGEQPICVMACGTRALDFGPLDALIRRHGANRDLLGLPCSVETRPAVVIKPRVVKRQIVPYDSAKALALMLNGVAPEGAPADIAAVMARAAVGRDRLVIKHESVDDLMRRLRNDEG